MSVRIDAVTAQRSAADSRTLAAQSAEACLRQHAGQSPCDLPLLVYAGVYRDGNVVEPAQAPYAQRALADGGTLRGSAFSFDVDHLLSGIEVADGMIRTQKLGRAMVVGVDSAVTYTEPSGLRFDPAAGALLLTPSTNGEGFSAYRTDVYAEHRELHQGRLVWVGEEEGGPRHEMIVAQSERYLGACIDSAVLSLRTFCEEVDMSLSDGTLIIPSQSPMGFPGALRAELGLPETAVVDATSELGPVSTAGPLFALQLAMADGRWSAARRVLFVTVSPGIVVSMALYEQHHGRPV